MFENYKVFETDFAGRPLVIETGKMTQLANGACLVRYGETVVHVAVTAAPKPREGVDFFPLSVDFEEKQYAMGKIPGGFGKREGRPSEKSILVSRVIDRPIRPLFPKDMRNDVSIVCTVMAYDPDCLPEIAAMVGTSIALSISDVPWNGPISAVSVGLVDGEFVINPTKAQRDVSQMAVTVASTDSRIAMIEAGANIVPDDVMYNGIMAGHEANQAIIEFIKGIQAEIGREKFSYPSNEPEPEMYEAIKAFAIDDIRVALDTDDKKVRDERLKPIYDAVHAKFDEIYPDQSEKIEDCLYKTQKYIVRRWLFRWLLRSVFCREYMAPVCLPEDRHKYLPLPRLVLSAISRFLTVSTIRLLRDTFTIITSRLIPLVKQSPPEVPAAVKSVMVPWQKERWCRLFLP